MAMQARYVAILLRGTHKLPFFVEQYGKPCCRICIARNDLINSDHVGFRPHSRLSSFIQSYLRHHVAFLGWRPALLSGKPNKVTEKLEPEVEHSACGVANKVISILSKQA